MENELKFAVLIDADNISDKYIKIILEETANNGVATYKRIYGDWTSPQLSSWKNVLLDNSIIPMQQYSYTTGKNATDSAMIIDAMDILYSGTVDGFCIASSDSDFTRLAARLRESGMQVIGMGESKTPQPVSYTHLDVYKRQLPYQPVLEKLFSLDRRDGSPCVYSDADSGEKRIADEPDAGRKPGAVRLKICAEGPQHGNPAV